MKRRKVVCKHCNKEIAVNMIARHEGPCSRKKSYRESTPIEAVSTLLENGKYSCNECLKEYSRKGISTHYWLNHGAGNNHLTKILDHLNELHESQRGKPSWNSGLTAENDERIARARENLLKTTQLEDYRNSRRGVKLDSTTKEKISEARSRFLNECGNGGFKDVKWYKSVDSFGNECSLRGTWELKVAQWLDAQGIKWTRKYYVKYLDGDVNRTYSPDFFIPDDMTIIEVKGYFSERDRRKMTLVKEQNTDLVVKILMKNEIEQLNSLSYNNI
jgi:hypothetical protein